ncbi:MAG: hypothetical protein RL027_642 [Pseudomonadota bacterium]|jgi:hypothetical protein
MEQEQKGINMEDLRAKVIEEAKAKKFPHQHYANQWIEQRINELQKEEAKLLGSAMEQLLPEIYENKRAIPNVFLRGGLFGLVRKGRRALVKDMPIFTMSQYEIKFSGEQMDQNDLELWDTLIYLAKNRNVNNALQLTLYDLCKEMDLSPTQKTYARLIARIERLQLGQVKISTFKQKFFGSLINNGFVDQNGKLVIEYNKKLMPLFVDNDFTFVDNTIRQQLGDNQLSRWLFCFYATHKEPIPFSFDFLHKLSGSCAEKKEFNRKIKLALEEIKQAYLRNQIKWEYEIYKNKKGENFLAVNPKDDKLDITKLIEISK